MDFLAPNHQDSESDSEAGQVSRENLQVGARIPCPLFQAQCIGDDMTWRGSKVLRVAALQAGRTGTDARFVGRWWGSSLTQLGADLGCVSEIGLSNSQLAPLLLEGFSDAGFTAICHGPPEEGLAPRGGAGVALVVRRSIISTWSDISRDRLGRCIASTLYLSSGLPLRVIGVYAITGSSLPGFEGNAFQVAAESQLVRFIQEQLQAADVQGMTCLHCVCPSCWSSSPD